MNPYESPIAECDAPATTNAEIRRPAFGTFLIVIWLLEGGFKAYLLSKGLLSGFNPIPFIVEQYRQSSTWLFFTISSFLFIETIGSWIGIFYLTGRRSRTLPFDAALVQTLKVASGLAIVATFMLVLLCRFAVRP